MAVVNIQIGSRNYTLSCSDGEESHIQELAKEVHKRVQEISDAVGGNTSDSIILAMATLMMQDELNDLRKDGAPATSLTESADSESAVSDAMEAISDYVETIAERIEKG